MSDLLDCELPCGGTASEAAARFLQGGVLPAGFPTLSVPGSGVDIFGEAIEQLVAGGVCNGLVRTGAEIRSAPRRHHIS